MDDYINYLITKVKLKIIISCGISNLKVKGLNVSVAQS